MKNIIKFLRSTGLIIIGIALGAGIWYTSASLSIPTSIDNAVQVIKKIIISDDGVSMTGTGVMVTIDANATGSKVTVVGSIQVGQSDNSINNNQGGRYSSVLGGQSNKINSGGSSTIGGGITNQLTGNNSTIIGGQSNNINADNSSVGGGKNNTVNGSQSTIIGGEQNTISNGSDWSTIVGGNQNVVNGDYSFAGGYKVNVQHPGVFAWSDYQSAFDSLTSFNSVTGSTFIIRAKNGVMIGTASPATKPVDLRVIGTSANSGGKIGTAYYCDQNGDNCVAASSLGQGGGDSYWTAVGSDIRNSNTGNVGIGTNDPKDVLQVKNLNFRGSTDQTFITHNGYYNGSWLRIGASYAMRMAMDFGQFMFDVAGSGSSGSAITWIRALHIDNNGRVGIGTSSPSVSLQVDGSFIAGSSSNQALGNNSVAMGGDTKAGGTYSTAMGYGSKANSSYSTAMGASTNASGYASTAMGMATNANGDRSTSMGYVTNANGGYSTVVGTRNVGLTNSIFEIGIGYYNGSDFRRNAITVLFNSGNFNDPINGRVGIGTTGPTEKLDVDGGVRIRSVSLASSSNNVLAIDGSGKVHYIPRNNFLSGSSNWTVDGNNIYNSNAGNVGIGTGSPSQKLDVAGHININDSLYARGTQIFTYPSRTNGRVWFNYEGSQYSGVMFMGDVKISARNPANNGGNKGNLTVDGKVGIGDVPTAISTNNVLVRDATGTIHTISTANLFSGVSKWTANGNNIYNSNAGNVGIGTTTPNAPLQFANGVASRKIVLHQDGNNDHQVYGLGVDSYVLRYQVPSTSASHIFYAGYSSLASNEIVRMQGDGKVGIGASNLSELGNGTTAIEKVLINGGIVFNNNNIGYGSAALDARGSRIRVANGEGINGQSVGNLDLIAGNSSNTRGGSINLIGGRSAVGYSGGRINLIGGYDTTLNQYGDIGLQGANILLGGHVKSSNTMNFQGFTNSYPSLYVGYQTSWSVSYGNAKVGIGTTGRNNFALDVRGGIYSNGSNGGVTNYAGVFMGDVGIGIATPSSSYKLHVIGTGYFSRALYAQAFYYHSDRRYKENMELISDPLAKIAKLNGYYFDWKDGGKYDIGVIAQEVEKVFPMAVSADDKGYKSVEYGHLVAPIIEAVKALIVKVDDLFDKYVDQKNQIDQLERRIEKLEKISLK